MGVASSTELWFVSIASSLASEPDLRCLKFVNEDRRMVLLRNQDLRGFKECANFNEPGYAEWK